MWWGFFDPMYLFFMMPALIIAGLASAKTKGTFNKYSRITSSTRLTGAQAARKMLDQNGLHEVKIYRSQGFLSDHYNPTNRSLNLSPKVHDSESLSAIGVACHEAGHALQHSKNYTPLQVRSAMVPVTQFSSFGAYIFIVIGALLNHPSFILLGVILMGIGFIFSLITLPVEWDATNRAKKLMVTNGIVLPQEAHDAGKVLDAAFLTYVAAAISALMTLLYYMWRLGLFGRK